MAKKAAKENSESHTIEFVVDEFEPISSKSRANRAKAEIPAIGAKPAAEIDIESRSPAFNTLAQPKLPVLKKQNRARLQIQSPNRIFFYWSLKGNPFHSLQKILGGEIAGYSLVLRLVDVATEREEIQPIEFEGTHWFNTDAEHTYRAEIGFYSTTKPFVRIVFSNTVVTPRKSPSHRVATEADWRVGAYKFAQVLDVSGFKKDAFDVAIAGNDVQTSDEITHTAFRQLIGKQDVPLESIAAEELRYAMLAIASGRALEELRWKIGAGLFAILQAHATRLAAGKAAAVLSEYFDIDEVELEEEEYGEAVFGSSRVNFPKRFKTRTRIEYSPVSSRVFGN